MAKPAHIGKDGWVSVEVDDDLSAFVHVTGGPGEEVTIDGIYLHGENITTATFRRIHPARLLADVNAQERTTTMQVRWSKDESRIGESYDRTLPGSLLTKLAARSQKDDADLTLGQLRARAKGRRIPDREREPLGRPDTSGDLDGFYKRMAAAYTSAAATSGKPAHVLAEENGVPIDTVHRWAKEARRRGHLAPGRRRKAN